MKSILSFGAICLLAMLYISPNLIAQRQIDETYRISQSEELSMNLKFPESIVIRHWNRQEVNIQAEVVINEGKNNEAFKLSTERKGGVLYIQSEVENIEDYCHQDKKYREYNTRCIEIDFVIYIPETTDIALETISGNIEMEDHAGDIKIKSIGGFVDLSISPRTSADIEMKTIGGEIYSDLEIPSEDSMRKIAGYEINHTLNRGGRRVSLESIGGNIYLRKR